MRRLLIAVVLLCVASPSRGAEADKYLPDDTDGVLTLNVKQVLDAPVFKTHYHALAQKFLKDTPLLQKECTALGLDPFKDLDRLLVVSAESSRRIDEKTGKGRGGVAFILHGRFDPAKVHARAAQLIKDEPRLLRVEKAAGGSVYELGLAQPLYLAFADKTTIVASPFKDHVTDAMEKSAGKRKTKLKFKETQDLIAAADGKQALWVALTGRMAYATADVKNKAVKQTLEGVGMEAITGGVALADDIKTAFTVRAKDDKAAKEIGGNAQQDLNATLELILPAALKSKPLDPLRTFLQNLEVIAKDKIVTIQGEVTAKSIEESLK